jgi:hypothetical protein
VNKRPTVDLKSITSSIAAPMAEAVQRVPETPTPVGKLPKSLTRQANIKTADLEPLSFKVPPAFRRRFMLCAAHADLKHIELLFEALDAWEEKQGGKK